MPAVRRVRVTEIRDVVVEVATDDDFVLPEMAVRAAYEQESWGLRSLDVVVMTNE